MQLVYNFSTSKHSCRIYSLPYEFPLSGTKKSAFAQAITNFLLACPVVIYIVGTSQFLRAKILFITMAKRLCVSHLSRKKPYTRVSRSKQANVSRKAHSTNHSTRWVDNNLIQTSADWWKTIGMMHSHFWANGIVGSMARENT